MRKVVTRFVAIGLSAIGGMLAGLNAAHAQEAAGPSPAFYEGFEKGKVEAGVVGKAGASFRREARDIVDMDRGTLAFFIKSDKGVQINNWNRMAGLDGPNSGSYWRMVMDWNGKMEDYMFNLYDIGRYSPPLRMPSPVGRWKPGQWVHMAVVWDRQQGVTVYEDGKRVASNWGEYRWNWSLTPLELFVGLPVDELYVFNETLTDAQVAQVAKGEKPTGLALPPLPSSQGSAAKEMARMGWTEEGLEELARVKGGEGVSIVYSRIQKAVAAKRPIATPMSGIAAMSWPDIKYGASTRGKQLDLELAEGARFDRMRLFVQRPFTGALTHRLANGQTQTMAGIDVQEPSIWHKKLSGVMTDREVIIKREYGALGPIDFYRVEAMGADALGTAAPKKAREYRFEKAEGFAGNEAGMTLKAQTTARLRRPVLGTEGAAAAWTLQAPVFGGFQGTTAPMADARAFDGVVVKLVAEGMTKPTPVRITVNEPIYGVRTWLSAEVVLEPKGAGKQVYTVRLQGRPVINMPEYQVRKYLGNGKYDKTPNPVAGAVFGVSVTAGAPVTWAMGDGGCSFAFTETEMKGALGAAADAQVEFMREGYAEEMEGHNYGSATIVYPLRWLCMFAPERMETRQMYERSGSPQFFEGIQVPALKYEKPSNNTGAPDWAFWQMKVMAEHRKIVDYYIDQKQVETGEYGGVWNDDTDHVEQWLEMAMCMDGSGKMKKSLHKFWDGLWNLQLEQGVGKYVQDSCHYYEEGMGSMGMRLLLDYGDPTAYARALTTCSHYGKWLTEDGKGGLGNISEFMSLNENWTQGERFASCGGRRGHNGDMIVPAAYLIWYNRHPEMARIYRGWFNGAEPGMGSGLKAQTFDVLSDQEVVKRNYVARLREGKLGNPGSAMEANELIDAVGVDAETRAKLGQPYKPLTEPLGHYPAYYSTEWHWYLYATSGDVRYLTDSYQLTCAWFYGHDWLNSRAEPTMDRNPLPRSGLVRARTGGMASNRGAARVMWPSYGLSYTKGCDNVAALVMENKETGLSARFYSFADKPQEMGVKVWRLDPGMYEVVLSKDANDDGKGEGVIWREKMELDRGAPMTVTLPAKESVVMEIVPIKTTKPVYDKPDAAIGEGTVELVYDDHLVVRVYNNGTKPVENVLVRVRDMKSGKVIGRGEQRIGRIDAPVDMKPRFKAVEFLNVSANVQGGVIVEIDPEREVEDLNRHNNRVEVRF
jgi:hypothetical protein